MRISRVAAVLLVCTAAHAGAQTAAYAVFSPQAIAQMRGMAGGPVAQKIIARADAALVATPDPMPIIHEQGMLPHEGNRDASIMAEQDWFKMLDLALAYRLSGSRKYLDAETRLLSAWIAVYKTSLNPIDETRFDAAIFAFDLTRADLPPTVRTNTLTLFTAMATGYLEFVETNSCGKNAENWQSHRIKLAVLTAYETGDAGLMQRAARALATQVGCNVRPDGSVEDFYKRDALHYVVYDLEPLETAALAAKAHGQDWFHVKSASGSSLAGAVDWLLPYTSGAEKHQEFVHSTVPFDAARDKAGEAGYSGEWNVQNGVTTLALASLLDAKYAQPLASLEEKTGKQPPSWIQILGGMHAAQ
jgi:hypothetical protein